MPLKTERVHDLLYQAAETEQAGVSIYETALLCVRKPELREEWTKYLAQTRRHVEVTRDLLEAFDLDPDRETPGRRIVRATAQALVTAMRHACDAGDAAAAEIVAAECVVHAETKDHLNWELLSECVPKAAGAMRDAIQDAVDVVEDEEDEHLYHGTGWTRELWLEALGPGGVFPPPEERKDVRTAIGAARAARARKRAARSQRTRRGPARKAGRRSAAPRARRARTGKSR